MFKALLMTALAVTMPFSQAQAQGDERARARMFVNDALGDGHDRWRSGAYFVAGLWGDDTGQLPVAAFRLWEWRLRAEIVAPEDLVTPAPGDRRYAGIIAPGIFTHFAPGGFEAMVGLEAALTGPQTGLGDFQREVHEWLDMPLPQVLDDQIPNGIHPTLRAELGRPFAFGGQTWLRPFIEAQAGLETFARAGFDLTWGGWGQSAPMLRETVTGFRTEGAGGSDGRGLSVTFGADMARVFDSELLPAGGAAQLADTRSRARLGVNWQGEKSEAFYGLAWLGEEYDGQPGNQVLGAIRLRLNF